MPRQPIVLAALFAPGSIESEVGKAQAAVFAEHGCASAQALPPLVPIAFLDAACAEGSLLREMNRAIAPGWRMRLIGTGWVEGHLFGRVDSAGAWPALRECALARCGPEAAGLFPVAEGFYLGCGEVPDAERESIIPSLPELSFGSATLSLMRITATEGPDWWRALSWETFDERPLRGRKQQ
jgi:hypothetical protein